MWGRANSVLVRFVGSVRPGGGLLGTSCVGGLRLCGLRLGGGSLLRASGLLLGLGGRGLLLGLSDLCRPCLGLGFCCSTAACCGGTPFRAGQMACSMSVRRRRLSLGQPQPGRRQYGIVGNWALRDGGELCDAGSKLCMERLQFAKHRQTPAITVERLAVDRRSTTLGLGVADFVDLDCRQVNTSSAARFSSLC